MSYLLGALGVSIHCNTLRHIEVLKVAEAALASAELPVICF